MQKTLKTILLTDANAVPDPDPVLGLWNPYSKVTCIILYLYSMELGTPTLYAEANRVAR